MSRKEKKLDLSFTQELAPSELKASKENWQEMRQDKRVMRERRNRKRNYA